MSKSIVPAEKMMITGISYNEDTIGRETIIGKIVLSEEMKRDEKEMRLKPVDRATPRAKAREFVHRGGLIDFWNNDVMHLKGLTGFKLRSFKTSQRFILY
jgi:hypothetical protein